MSEGYVSVDDWADVDPVKMLDTIRENTEEANAERRRQGFGEMHRSGVAAQNSASFSFLNRRVAVIPPEGRRGANRRPKSSRAMPGIPDW
jgi:hypothetical protein